MTGINFIAPNGARVTVDTTKTLPNDIAWAVAAVKAAA